MRVPLATSPAPPQRPARPALILPCPRRRPGPEEWDCKLRSPAALTSRGHPGPQTERVPLAASPAPPPRPSRPAPIRPCPTKRAGWENGIVPNTPSRARVARPPWNSGLVSPARILAYAAAAPVAPSSIWPCSRIAQQWDCRHPRPSAARAVRELRSRVARGLSQKKFNSPSPSASPTIIVSLSHTARRHTQVMTLISGEGGWLPLRRSLAESRNQNIFRISVRFAFGR